MTLGSEVSGSAYAGVSFLKFSGGVDWTIADLMQFIAVSQQQTEGADTAIGGAEVDDIIQGRGGDDTLQGQRGSDQFVFAPGSGHDVIVDFKAGGDADQIDLVGYGVTSFASLMNASEQIHDDVVIQLDANDTILLKNVSMLGLSASASR